MKKSNIINLAIAILGFTSLLAGFVILMLGCLKASEDLIMISFIPMSVGIALLVYILGFICYKLLKNRK